MITDLQRYQAVKKRVEQEVVYPDNFLQLINRAAELNPDKTALHFFERDESCTFSELQDRVFALADGLHQQGIVKGSHVAIMLTNRIEFPLTWLALGVLGAVMIPINVRYTANELDYVLNDGEAEFFLLEECFLTLLTAMEKRPPRLVDEHIISVGESEQKEPYTNWEEVQASGCATYRPDWQVSTEDLLNIQYTSGTTGFPKGCMQSQRYWIYMGAGVFEMIPEKVNSILTDHSYFYMDPLWQLVMGLYGGATVYAASRMSASQFLPRVQKYNIEFAWFPRPLIGAPANPEERNTSLKKMFIGGASAEGIRHIRERFGVSISDGYGMTEIGPGLFVPDEITDPDILGSCGLPAAFRECKVINSEGQECGADEPGELWVRGPGVFNGYYNKPEANAESFVDDWFRTGDTFVRSAKGYHKIVGRTKDMIRRSSENIAALEVEMSLAMHPAIELAAALPVADDYRGEEVKVYLMLRDNATAESLPPAEVIAHCATKLAAFKVPRYIEYVQQLPLTPTLKVAKHKLKAEKADLREGSWDNLDQVWR